jgi:hypothetical protein
MSNNNQEPTVNNIPLNEYDELLDLQRNYDKHVAEVYKHYDRDKESIRKECWERYQKDLKEYLEKIDKLEKECNESTLKEKIEELGIKYYKEQKKAHDRELIIATLKQKLRYKEEDDKLLKNRTLIQRIFRKYE